MPSTKPCIKCGKTDRYKSGDCRPCHLKRSKESILNLSIEERKNRLLRTVKCRAKKNNLQFELTVEDIHWPVHCPVYGFERDYKAGHNAPNGISLDRFDNTKGYVKGNVNVISRRANTLKKDATVEELVKVLDYLCNPSAYASKQIEEFPKDDKYAVRQKLGYKSLKNNAKQRGHSFELAEADYRLLKECPVLGTPIAFHNNKIKHDSLSVDRIDNNKHYTKDNIVLMSWKANSLKSNSTPEELAKVVEYMTNFKEKRYRDWETIKQ